MDQRALRSTDYVADEQRSVERDIIESLPHWRESGTDFRSREITYLVDTLQTVPPHDSWLTQLADCLALPDQPASQRLPRTHEVKKRPTKATFAAGARRGKLSPGRFDSTGAGPLAASRMEELPRKDPAHSPGTRGATLRPHSSFCIQQEARHGLPRKKQPTGR